MRCPRCASGSLFRRWVSMVDSCPRCGHRFERSDGFWLGSIMINNAATFAAVIGVFVITMILTWPDVPWTGLLVAVILTALIVPIVFHPISRSLWVGMELAARPLSEKEILAAAGRLETDVNQTIETSQAD